MWSNPSSESRIGRKMVRLRHHFSPHLSHYWVANISNNILKNPGKICRVLLTWHCCWRWSDTWSWSQSCHRLRPTLNHFQRAVPRVHTKIIGIAGWRWVFIILSGQNMACHMPLWFLPIAHMHEELSHQLHVKEWRLTLWPGSSGERVYSMSSGPENGPR